MESVHEIYLQECIRLATVALDRGDPPVGAILVYEEEIIGLGVESGRTMNDVTMHAEILAIKDAIKKQHQEYLNKSTLYTTHEPCIMCSYLIRHHKIPQIVFGAPVLDVGGYHSEFKVLQTEKLQKWNPKPRIIHGICEAECQALSKRYEEKLKA